MTKLLNANGQPMPPSQEEVEARGAAVNKLMTDIMACFPQPITQDDVLTAGVNLVLAFACQDNNPKSIGERANAALNVIGQQVVQRVQAAELSARVAAGLRRDGMLQ